MFMLGEPRRGTSREERIALLEGAMRSLKWAIANKDPRVRGAVLMGLYNDRCDPIWKTLKKIVAKTDIDWDELKRAAKCIIGPV